MIVLLAVLAGGVGAAARFVVDGAVSRRWTAPVPVATTVVNVSGSFLLGVVVGLVDARGAPGALAVVAGTGLLGGYTTFSTASVEVVRLLREHRRRAAALHAAAVLLGSTAAAAFGLALSTLA